MKLGTDTGSLINHIVTEANQPAPKVGDGATICHWSDRHAGTVIGWDGKTVTVQKDKATRVDKGMMTDCQSYTYEADPNGTVFCFKKDSKGKWRAMHHNPDTGKLFMSPKGNGAGLWLGVRDEHYDYSF